VTGEILLVERDYSRLRVLSTSSMLQHEIIRCRYQTVRLLPCSTCCSPAHGLYKLPKYCAQIRAAGLAVLRGVYCPDSNQAKRLDATFQCTPRTASSILGLPLLSFFRSGLFIFSF